MFPDPLGACVLVKYVQHNGGSLLLHRHMGNTMLLWLHTTMLFSPTSYRSTKKRNSETALRDALYKEKHVEFRLDN